MKINHWNPKAIRLTKQEQKNVFGGLIRKFRDEKCLSQEYVASKLGIGQSAFNKIENGKISVSEKRLKEIAYALGISVNEFFNEEDVILEMKDLLHVVTEIKKIIELQAKEIEFLKAKVKNLQTLIEKRV